MVEKPRIRSNVSVSTGNSKQIEGGNTEININRNSNNTNYVLICAALVMALGGAWAWTQGVNNGGQSPSQSDIQGSHPVLPQNRNSNVSSSTQTSLDTEHVTIAQQQPIVQQTIGSNSPGSIQIQGEKPHLENVNIDATVTTNDDTHADTVIYTDGGMYVQDARDGVNNFCNSNINNCGNGAVNIDRSSD